MKDIKLYKNLNEIYTDENQSEIIRRVFENKTKTDLTMRKMAEGGGVNDEVYTPYEFLHELLPQVYGRKYIVSDAEAERMTIEIEKEQQELDDYTLEQIKKYDVSRIYEIDNEDLITEIEVRRKTIESKKIFVSESELKAYLFCHPEIDSTMYLREPLNVDVLEYLKKGLIYFEYEPRYYDNNINQMIEGKVKYAYKHEYLSGNIYKKISDLYKHELLITEESGYSEEITKAIINAQKQILELYKPKMAEITLKDYNRINIAPSSTFSTDIFNIRQEDWANEVQGNTGSLKRAFSWWVSYEMDSTLLNKATRYSIQKYFIDLEKAGDTSTQNEKRQAYSDGERIFPIFLFEAFTDECKRRIEFTWNELYNNYAEVPYGKIPVALTCSKKWKGGQPFLPNETQIQSVQYIKSAGSGLLAYGVGVGKTASSILNVSYAFDNNLSKKALFVVPNPTYSKWILEIKGGEQVEYIVKYTENGVAQKSVYADIREAKKFAKEVKGEISENVKVIKGILPHLPPIVDLYNLGEDYVMNIKQYTEQELQQIKNIDTTLEMVKGFPENYTFDNVDLNEKIRKYYDDFEPENISKEYEEYFKEEAKKQKVQYPQLPKVNNPKKFMYDKIKGYRRELPFVLGRLKSFPEKTIFICTYEGLKFLGKKLTDSTDVINDESVFGKLFHELSQGENVSNFYRAGRDNGTAKKLEEVIYGIEDKRKIDVSELELDYAVIDESHYFKKVYTCSKGLPDSRSYGTRNDGLIYRKDRKYTIGGISDAPSKKSLSGWAITRLIQDRNNGSNVIQMTATPFTNKPAEIFSMLAMTNYKRLIDSGFRYMEEFYDVFMKIDFTLRKTSSEKIVRAETLNGFNNLPQLRKLIYGIMDYKSGEDANIKRPDKILYPSIAEGRETSLPPTPQQAVMLKDIKNYIAGKIQISELCGDIAEATQVDASDLGDSELIAYIEEEGTEAQIEKFVDAEMTDELRAELVNVVQKMMSKEKEVDEEEVDEEEEKKFIRVAKGINLMKQVTLSPYLSTCTKESGIEPTAEQYINSSPKLQYVIECIKSTHDYEKENNLRKSGIVMYMNMGVHPSFKGYKWSEGGFEKIKKYIVQKYGYNPSEISIIHGKISRTEKEKEKNKFLAGISTILIGSSTISTGVDLQNNSSALFMCAFDWNPTDNEQIQGRIHRQGNRFAKVRIVYPMIANSSDIMIFGSLVQKTNRIKSIWDKYDKGTTLDLKDFDPNYYEKQLLTDPEDKVKLWEQEKSADISDEINYIQNRRDSLNKAKDEIDIYTKYRPVMIALSNAIEEFDVSFKKKEAKDKYVQKRQEILDELTDDDVKLAKELTKLKKETYDVDNDPEGRFLPKKYDNIEDEELLEVVNKLLSSNASSYMTKLDNDSSKWQDFILFIRNYYSDYFNGNWKPYTDDKVEIRWYRAGSIMDVTNAWKGAKREMKKVNDQLAVLGIDYTNINDATQQMLDRQEALKLDLENIKQEIPKMYEYFVAEAEKKKEATPSVSERVMEFAQMHYILKEQIQTFAIDRAKVVEVPKEKLPVKPKSEIEEKAEKSLSDEGKYLKDKIGSFELLLDIEDDKEEMKYLESKIESFQLLLELED